jgi:hypothetical protein
LTEIEERSWAVFCSCRDRFGGCKSLKNGCCAFFGHSPSTVPAAHYACDDSSPTVHRSAVMFNRLSKLVKRKEDGAGAGDEPSPVAPAPAPAPAPSPALQPTISSGSAGALRALQSVHGGGGTTGHAACLCAFASKLQHGAVRVQLVVGQRAGAHPGQRLPVPSFTAASCVSRTL